MNSNQTPTSSDENSVTDSDAEAKVLSTIEHLRQPGKTVYDFDDDEDRQNVTGWRTQIEHFV